MSSVTSTSSSTNVTRITGMATGMDTDAMVKAMTANYQNKIDKTSQEAQIVEWKQEAYRDIIKDVKNLQDYFDPLSSKYIMSSNKFNPVKVTNSSESTVGFNASPSAQTGNYKISVGQLAKPAVVQGNAISATATLKTKLVDLSIAKDDEITFNINGASPKVKVTDTTTIQDVLDAINNDASVKNEKVTASFDELSKKIVFSTSSSGASTNLSVSVSGGAKLGLYSKIGGSALADTTTASTKLEGAGGLGMATGSNVDFTINGKTISVTTDATTTIQNVLDNINSDADIKNLGVIASFDETSKKFVFGTNGSGTASSINVSVTGGTKLGLDSPLTVPSVTGQNAKFTLNYPDGRTESLEQPSNQFTANGITYNLKSTGSSDITVAKNDVDSVVNNLKSFITDYNNIIGKIQSKLTEKKQYTYKPLTDEQKKDMKDADIKNWEGKCKQGILKNDSYLENMLTNLRTVFGDGVYSSVDSIVPNYDPKNPDGAHREGTTAVKGTKNQFVMGVYGNGALGLDTAKEMADSGKIIIKDETKLRDAIAKDPEAFANFFTQKSSRQLDQLKDAKGDPLKNPDGTLKTEEYAGSKKYYEDGIFARLDAITRKYVGDPGIGKDGTSTAKGYLNIFANKQYDFSLTGSAGQNTMPDQIYAKALSVDKLQKKMKEMQDQYYKKFAALETAMNNMNAQLSNFKSQMGIS